MSRNSFLESDALADSSATFDLMSPRDSSPFLSPRLDMPQPLMFDRRRIDQYDIIYPLAKGGMATVFVAQLSGMAGFEKLVALKVVHPHLSAQREFVEMFFDEARVAARIEHPNIAQIHGIGEDNGLLYMVGELVQGQSLRTVLRRMREDQSKASTALAVDICSKVALGLHAAHEQRGEDKQLLNVVHRDVSPANILLSYEGNVKLVDFGIAYANDRWAITRNGQVKGKPCYMSPEQIGGEPPDRRDDIYAIGVNLYQLTTGRLPFPGTIDTGVFDKIMAGTFVRPRQLDPNLPPALEAIILRAMSIDRNDRFSTALEMARALEDVALTNNYRSRPEVIAKGMNALFGAERQEHEAKVAAFREQLRVKGRGIAGDRPRRPTTTPPFAAPRRFPPSQAMPLALFAVVLLLGLGLPGPSKSQADWETTQQSRGAPSLSSAMKEAVIAAKQLVAPEPVSPMPVTPTVNVSLEIFPPGAQLMLDGIVIESGTDQLAMEPDGKTHVLVIRAEGYYSTRQEFVVTQPAALTVSLVKKRPRPPQPTSLDDGTDAAIKGNPYGG